MYVINIDHMLLAIHIQNAKFLISDFQNGMESYLFLI